MVVFVQLTLAFSNHLNDKHTDTDIMTNVQSTTPAGGIWVNVKIHIRKG